MGAYLDNLGKINKRNTQGNFLVFKEIIQGLGLSDTCILMLKIRLPKFVTVFLLETK